MSAPCRFSTSNFPLQIRRVRSPSTLAFPFRQTPCAFDWSCSIPRPLTTHRGFARSKPSTGKFSENGPFPLHQTFGQRLHHPRWLPSNPEHLARPPKHRPSPPPTMRAQTVTLEGYRLPPNSSMEVDLKLPDTKAGTLLVATISSDGIAQIPEEASFFAEPNGLSTVRFGIKTGGWSGSKYRVKVSKGNTVIGKDLVIDLSKPK